MVVGIKEYLKDNLLIFDGAMGTMLQKEGLPIGDNPEIFGMKNPDKLLKIHKKYLEAGCNVLTTNTFGCNELKVTKLGYTVEEIIDKYTKGRMLGIFGEEVVNVLEVNLALDGILE